MQRGDVIRANLPQPQGRPGREQFGTRPAVVIQDNRGAYLKLQTVVVVPLTSQLRALAFAGSFRVEPSAENGLALPSVVLTQQLRAIDAARVECVIGRLSEVDLGRLDDELRSLLGL